MADARINSADLLLVKNTEEIVGVIQAHHKKVPEWGLFPASPVSKTTYNTFVRTALPAVAFRAVNTGRERTKGTYDQRTVTCKFLDASWDMDTAIARAWEWGSAAAQAMARNEHILSAMKAVADQIYYGTSADANGFAGLASIKDNNDDEQVVDAGGDTAAGCTSVWAVRWSSINPTPNGPLDLTLHDGVEIVWGQDATLQIGEIETVKTYDSANGGYFYAPSQQIDGYVGLQIANYEAFGRICNVDADHVLTDILLADLLSKFRVGEKPDVLLMNRTALNQLRDSRTATNAQGIPAPFPEDAFKVPIVVTDSILDTETPLEAAGT